MRIHLLIITAVFTIACGPKLPPTLTPEAKVAARGAQLIDALRATLPHIKALTCQPQGPAICIKPDDTIKIAVNMSQAADYGTELGNALMAVHESRSAGEDATALQRVSTILSTIQSLLTKSLLIPQGAEVQAALSAVFAGVNALMFSVLWSE